MIEEGLSVRRACKVLVLHVSVFYYQCASPRVRGEDLEVEQQLQALAEAHPTYGFWKMYHLIRHSGHSWNHKRVRRIYLKLRLNMKRKRKRRLPDRVREPMNLPIATNITWSVDFMEDTLTTGKRFRTLNVIDDHNREALMIMADTSISGHRLCRELDRLIDWRGKPEAIRCDNGPEFTSVAFTLWCKKKGIEIRFIQPGKPSQNSLIERFNRTYRQEVLNAWLFDSLNEVRDRTSLWMWEYNNVRPHVSLNNLTPVAFNNRFKKPLIPTYLPDINTTFIQSTVPV